MPRGIVSVALGMGGGFQVWGRCIPSLPHGPLEITRVAWPALLPTPDDCTGRHQGLGEVSVRVSGPACVSLTWVLPQFHKSISFFKRSMIAVIAVILLDDADIKLKSNNLPP